MAAEQIGRRLLSFLRSCEGKQPGKTLIRPFYIPWSQLVRDQNWAGYQSSQQARPNVVRGIPKVLDPNRPLIWILD